LRLLTGRSAAPPWTIDLLGERRLFTIQRRVKPL
jgi:hypothetical protein